MTAVATIQQHTPTSSNGRAVYHSDSFVRQHQERIAGRELSPLHRLRSTVDARTSFEPQFAQHNVMSMRIVRPYCVSIQYCIH
jgi:hypothetical protein